MAARSSATRALAGPAIATAIAFVILIGLGIWQVERLGWKEALLARIDARIHQAPAPLPPQAQWASLKPDEYDYRHVTAKGRFLPGEALVFRAAAPEKGDRNAGPGYQIFAPFALDGGGIVLVDRGFAPLAWKDNPATRTKPPQGDVEVTGLMRPPEGRNMFTPADEPAKGIWFSRDPAAMAAAMKLNGVAPFAIDADADPNAKGWPHGGATEVDIPNNHLSYALTWFGLAATLLVVFGIWARGRLRREAPEADG